MTHRRRSGRTASHRFPLLVAIATGCGEPPVPLPESAQLPRRGVSLNMTYSDLMNSRPGATLIPDTGVVEALMHGSYHYGFTSNPPRKGSRLVYIDHVRDEMKADRARREWDTLVVALAGELGLDPRCMAIDHARLRWRRAMLREEGGPVAAAVEIVAVTTGDPGPGRAELVTRVWLPEHAAPVSRFLEAPEGAGGDLLEWEDCETETDYESSPRSPSP